MAAMTEDPAALEADAADEALGLLASGLVGGEDRPEQRRMARAVARALATGRHLVVQAGTGTGKSLAYAVPAALSQKKVVIATTTKALQDQLASKDLPAVVASTDGAVTFAVLKGRANDLCRQRAAEVAEAGFQPQLEVAGPDQGERDEGTEGEAPSWSPRRMADDVRRLVAWSDETETGDRGDLEFEPHPRAWGMLSVGPRECPGAFRCPEGHRCFAERARAEAAAADLVIVNTHLYGAHLASGGVVLPEHEVVVFDEAHELEEVMTASLGAEITAGRLRALGVLGRPLTGEDHRPALDDLATLADALERQLSERLGTRVFREAPAAPERPDPGPRSGGREPPGRERVRQPAPEDAAAGPEASPHAAADAELSRLLERIMAITERLSGSWQAAGAGALPGLEGDLGARRARALGAAAHLVGDILRVARRGSDEVVWVDGTRRAPVLRVSPIDVGPVLAETLWGEVTAVLTSATIPPRIAERLGLDPERLDQLDVGSPFDYRGHGLLYVARHLPDRRSEAAEAAIHEELEALVRAAGGRTLALFTSRRATDRAAAALRERLEYLVLVQGELPKARLLSTFSEDESSCLFATMGFWQGVDVPGRSLSLVTLDRLPFGRPDDPLLDARRERAGEAAFQLVDLPRAAALLAQGAGRLIRATDDYGVVAVLDPRLATASYRGVLLASMPPFRRTTERRQAEEFLARTAQ
jgi:ATP-dependent DNA helicase DinG